MIKFLCFILLMFINVGMSAPSAKKEEPLITESHNAAYSAEVKYLVSIQLVPPRKEGECFGTHHVCTGTIISPKGVLTSAYCAMLKHNTNKKFVVIAGSPSIRSVRSSTRAYEVTETLVYDGYNPDSKTKDLALLQLEEKLETDDLTIQDAIIAKNPPNPDPDTYCTALGWGAMTKGAAAVDDLRYAGLYYDESCIIPRSDKLCFSSSFDSVPTRYDYGGPLFCSGELAGVLSSVHELKAQYVNIWEYRNWIKEYGVDQFMSGSAHLSFGGFSILMQIIFLLLLTFF